MQIWRQYLCKYDVSYLRFCFSLKKDFGDVIPGHGGIMDRFDCQFLMATFVNVYISSFISTDSPQKLLSQVLYLKPEQQLQLFHMLKETLENRSILEPSPWIVILCHVPFFCWEGLHIHSFFYVTIAPAALCFFLRSAFCLKLNWKFHIKQLIVQ